MIYQSAAIKRTVVIHLDKGEDLLESVREVIKKEGIHSGLILSGYGTLDRVRWHYITTTGLPHNDEIEMTEGPFELVGMDGVIAAGEPHIHFDVADEKRSIAGHLEPGSRVLYLADVVIAELADVEMTFEVDEQTTLRCLNIKPGTREPGPAVDIDADGNHKISGRTTGWE